MPLSMICAGIGAAWIVWQHAQAYLPRMWRTTKNCAGTQSSCSLASSPTRLKAWPQAQWVCSSSCLCSMRGRLAGSAWRTGWRLVRAAGVGLPASSAARSSLAVSARMWSNSTACVLLSRLSLEEPKRQRFRRATSKFSASMRVCLNLRSACMRSIRSRSCCTDASVSGVCSVVASGLCSMVATVPSRARAREGSFSNGHARKTAPRSGAIRPP